MSAVTQSAIVQAYRLIALNRPDGQPAVRRLAERFLALNVRDGWKAGKVSATLKGD